MSKKSSSIRNHVARSPLLRKGGIHTQSKTSGRNQSKIITDSGIDEWYEATDTNSRSSNDSPSGGVDTTIPPQTRYVAYWAYW